MKYTEVAKEFVGDIDLVAMVIDHGPGQFEPAVDRYGCLWLRERPYASFKEAREAAIHLLRQALWEERSCRH